MKYIAVKNWTKFQHYTHRAPPWIKLYNELLNDYKWTNLPDACRAHLVGIWMLASKNNNRIPYDERWIAQQITATSPIDFQALIANGFIEVSDDASTMLASGASNMLAACASNLLEPVEKRRVEKSRQEQTDSPPEIPPDDGMDSVVISRDGNGKITKDETAGALDHKSDVYELLQLCGYPPTNAGPKAHSACRYLIDAQGGVKSAAAFIAETVRANKGKVSIANPILFTAGLAEKVSRDKAISQATSSRIAMPRTGEII